MNLEFSVYLTEAKQMCSKMCYYIVMGSKELFINKQAHLVSTPVLCFKPRPKD